MNRQTADRIHQVQKGDTLFGISKKYGLSVDTLKKINGLKNNDIQVGTSLIISIK
ncbi:MAG: LysM peptidoglycan-binding domain-containing protein [Flavobacteriaceae bacterium]|nr:LysM peptidoglycan-binding domain-containing protein [Flavobacteriaceae bacterium]MDP5024552.1 LysM peptidoglycan-binding domain-containing protein [Flavobacteriaceae bacterium]